MNRLTKYICGAAHGKCGRTVEKASKSKKYCRGEFEATGCVDRLAAYEDTGLEPEEIPQWIPISEPPKEPRDYLVWREGHTRPDIMRWRKNAGFDDHTFSVYGKVLYWAYLIQPPKGEK